MTMPTYSDDEFDQVVQGVDPHPYGAPVQPTTPKKTGLNTRGKVALSVAGLAIIGGGTLIYQNHTENVAAQQAKTAELQLQQSRLDLERLKVTNQIDEKQARQQKDEAKDLQAKVDACVAANKDQSAYLKGTVQACQDQYGTSTSSGADMQEAGSATNGDGGGGISPGLVIGVGVTVAAAVGFARYGRRPAATAGPHSNCH
jgi:uncharacterized protein HemX